MKGGNHGEKKREEKEKKEVRRELTLIFVLIFLAGTISVTPTITALEIGVSGEIGIDLIPDVPVNYSIVNVNNSQFFQSYTPTTLGEFFDGILNSTAWQRTGTNVFLANINDNVGIGTASPDYLLELSASAGPVLGFDDDNNKWLLQNYAGNFYFEPETTEGDLVFRDYGNIITLQLDHSENNVLIPNGNVGIGTTSPGEKLSVMGNVSLNNTLYVLENSLVGVGTTTPSYPLEVRGNVTSSNITIWAEGNISATGFITRTSKFDKSKNVWDYIKDASYYLVDGIIDHKKFYGYAGSFPITDYERPVEEEYIEEECNELIKGNETVMECVNITKTRTTYPYKTEKEGVMLDMEIDLFRQGLYELNERVKYLEENCIIE